MPMIAMISTTPKKIIINVVLCLRVIILMVFQTLITSVTDNIRQDIWRGQEDDRTASHCKEDAKQQGL